MKNHAAGKRGPGRPAHQPTAKDRKLVGLLVAAGVPQPEIASAMGMSQDTLARHYRDELDNGATRATGAVAGRLFKTATEGKGQPSVTAAIFWLKTRAGWKESIKVETPDLAKAFQGAEPQRLARLMNRAAQLLAMETK